MRRLLVEDLVRVALFEDLGRGGDLTTEAIVDAGREASADIVARAGGTIAGHDAAHAAFSMLDPRAAYEVRVPDGTAAAAGECVAVVRGNARALMTAERTALNFLCRLSGIATATRCLVDAVGEHSARITCTRKTTPGLRVLEKYAVRCGGGYNHRFGLDDAALIKDNHIALAGGVAEAIQAVLGRVGHMVKVEVEIDTLEQLRDALAFPIDAVLFDNMTLPILRDAVTVAGGRVLTEASGGITLERIPEIAATGVDLISVGWITHSAPALDLGLDVSVKGVSSC
ncbi:MAG: carboxylating nicotinate-nucleotide diphosphorylase [Candidatus Eremiobacteraeota bacterium]|nr:carboxylating nicotinate-nucleotide diphosphorylase [Candidatus Eremiobacteraeota bacterium]